MPAERTTVTIAEFTMDDFLWWPVLWQLGDLWIRPSDGPEATLLKLTRDPGLFLVARDGGGLIVGTVMGGWDGRRAYLYHLAVLPEWRQQGIADALMDEIEERFRRLGALKAKTQILMDDDTLTPPSSATVATCARSTASRWARSSWRAGRRPAGDEPRRLRAGRKPRGRLARAWPAWRAA